MISDWIVYSLGFLAQLLFSARMLHQWISSEKTKKVSAPTLFWILSLIASFLLFIYGWLRDDFAIMLGQSLSYFIYIRNLQLQGKWKKSPLAVRWFLVLFPILIVIYGYNNGSYDINQLFRNENIPLWLLLLGIIAQIIFTLRFVYQWIYSERKRESCFPKGFWQLCLTGAILILIYAVFRKDPVLFVGHFLGSIIYLRNLLILKKQDA